MNRLRDLPMLAGLGGLEIAENYTARGRRVKE